MLLPEIVSVAVLPVAAVEPGVRVNVLEVPAVTLAGPKLAVTPVGRPLIERLTVPVKPLAATTLMASVAEVPPEQTTKTHVGGFTVTLALFADSVNDGLATTVKLWVTEGAAA